MTFWFRDDVGQDRTVLFFYGVWLGVKGVKDIVHNEFLLYIWGSSIHRKFLDLCGWKEVRVNKDFVVKTIPCRRPTLMTVTPIGAVLLREGVVVASPPLHSILSR